MSFHSLIQLNKLFHNLIQINSIKNIKCVNGVIYGTSMGIMKNTKVQVYTCIRMLLVHEMYLHVNRLAFQINVNIIRMKITDTHTNVQNDKNKRKTYRKHTQNLHTPKHAPINYTHTRACMRHAILCFKDRFTILSLSRVHYQESNISSIVQ